ncbi:cytosolic sulfotransferase 3-like isoform X1 [Epinephelus fuscoguttatus]|uniref:cytosolic sulfotransferase 3-like isoform X1 n=2 Tax=Epinephelus fuscoguttatus TaxID=293821 RepID=UPI0020D08D8D|nr:cytosolic sulfotransferase 3-like isoform X1 [Epinephelus fuscoguttatus]
MSHHCCYAPPLFYSLLKMDLISRPELFNFHGVWMTHLVTDNWENIQNFQARPDDILIASYPKAGNTWVSYILDLLYFGQTSPGRQTSVPLYARVPFLEVHIPSLQPGSWPPPIVKGTELVDKLPTSPRIIKTHLPVQFVPKSFWEQNCKIVYVARNAKDSVVSYFHFERMTVINPEPGDWSSYLQRFLEGKVVFGSWYDHVNDWWEKKHSYPNLHYMFYEEMIEDTGRDLDKLSCFLGLSLSAEEKEEILRKVQFDEMKKNNMVNFSTFRAMDFKMSTFMRNGKVGDWKNHFTVAQSEQFDEDYKNKMKNSTLQFRTEVESKRQPTGLNNEANTEVPETAVL